jgi:hypothetical protein
MVVPEAERILGHRLIDTAGRGADWCDLVYLTSGPDSLAVMVVGSRIVRVDTQSRGVRTLAGVAVGDSVHRVFAQYGDRVSGSPRKYSDGQYLTVTPSDSGLAQFRIVFETDGRQIVSTRAGQLPEVAWVEGCS